MAKGDVLDWTTMVEGDEDKDEIFTNGMQRATKASHDTLSLSITGNLTTLTDAQFLDCYEINLSDASPAPDNPHTLRIPSWKKQFRIANGSSVAVQLETTDSPSATGPLVGPGQHITCYCDGTNIDKDDAAEWQLAGGGYSSPGVWDHAADGNAANVNFTGLKGAKEILIIGEDVTKSVSGQIGMRLSVDNGSTYLSTSGDYKSNAADGTTSNLTYMVLHTGNATAARSFMAKVEAANVNGAPKHVNRINLESPIKFAGSTDDVDAVRIYPDAGGNLTGGKIYCLVRK